MLQKSDLEPVFGAWYDHKMEPDDAEALRVHHSTLDILRTKMEEALGEAGLRRTDIKRMLGPRFGQWLKENDLPPLPKSS